MTVVTRARVVDLIDHTVTESWYILSLFSFPKEKGLKEIIMLSLCVWVRACMRHLSTVVSRSMV